MDAASESLYHPASHINGCLGTGVSLASAEMKSAPPHFYVQGISSSRRSEPKLLSVLKIAVWHFRFNGAQIVGKIENTLEEKDMFANFSVNVLSCGEGRLQGQATVGTSGRDGGCLHFRGGGV